jgi:hypothetical protein
MISSIPDQRVRMDTVSGPIDFYISNPETPATE